MAIEQLSVGLMDASRASAFLGQPLPNAGPLSSRFSTVRKLPITNLGFRRPKPTITSASEAEKIGEASPPSAVCILTPSNKELRTPHSGSSAYPLESFRRLIRMRSSWIQPRCCLFFAGIILMGRPGCSLRVGTSRYRSPIVGRASALCIPWRIRHFLVGWGCWIGQCMGIILLALGLRFLARKANIYASLVRSQRTFGHEFRKHVSEGFQVSPFWHQGFIRDDERSTYAQRVKTACWEYSTRPFYGWGDLKSNQKSTAGWLAAFPVFEPHWQICMASGLSTGWIEWDGHRYEFENAPSYSEKNWGGSFPRKWFWVQCNVFKEASGEIAVTAAGGLRKLFGVADNYENAALVGIHYGGNFYEFVPWNGTVSWEISQWGYWHISAENDKYMVELVATTGDPGTPLRAPTLEAGLVTACRDTCNGDLKLQMWDKTSDGDKGKANCSIIMTARRECFNGIIALPNPREKRGLGECREEKCLPTSNIKADKNLVVIHNLA